MELLIIKSGKNYIRFKNGNYLLVRIEKASVFPFNQMELVRQHESCLKEQGFENVSIKKLVLTEKDI